MNTNCDTWGKSGSFSIFPEASKPLCSQHGPVLSCRCLFSILGDDPFCQRHPIHNSNVLVLLGEVNQLLIAEDVAQLAWLTQTETGYWAISADYRNIYPRIISFTSNMKRSLKRHKSGSTWVPKKQLEATGEGKQFCLSIATKQRDTWSGSIYL